MPSSLVMQGITVKFGALVALENVSFAARYGSIHALLGENGAGKTTLMRVAFGLVTPESGSVEVDGKPLELSSTRAAIAAGIGMVHQQFSLIPAMTVLENVAIGGRGRLHRQGIEDRIKQIGLETGLMLDPEREVETLSSAERQKLEIVRTLAHDARILILDEPTTVLTPRDKDELFRQLEGFARAGGAVILITHKLADALRWADDVTVLRRGRTMLRAAMSEVDYATLTTAMLGAAPDTATIPLPPAGDDVVARLDDAIVSGLTGPVTLQVRGGEVLGVAALNGAAAGLLRVLAGRAQPSRGSATLPEKIGFVPENRQEEGTIPDFTLVDNFVLKDIGRKRGLIDRRKFITPTLKILEEFEIRAEGVSAALGSLSGGNQQRFLLGREFSGSPSLLVLENPTQGLDVKATSFIHERIRSACNDGTGVVFYSSDLDELLALAHRVVVIRRAGIEMTEPDREVVGRLLLETDAA